MIQLRFARILAIAFCAFLAVPAVARADAKADLLAAYQSMLDSRFESEMVSADKGKETRVQARYDTIKRVQMKTPDMEIIMVPEGTWMKVGGEWTKPPFDLGGMMQNLLPQSIDQVKSGITNVKDEGMVQVGGQSLRAISFDQSMSVMGIDVKSHNKVFIDGSGRIVRSEGEGEAMGRKSSHVQTIRYDDSIRVTAP